MRNLHAAFEQSLRARSAADRQRAIEREAFPAFHDAKVKARTDELAGFLTETLIAVTPVVSEVEAGYRAYRALNDYEAAAQSLLEFGTALTEAVPLGGRFAKGTRFASASTRPRPGSVRGSRNCLAQDDGKLETAKTLGVLT